MITKLLFTALVIVLVGALFHKQKNADNSAAGARQDLAAQKTQNKSISPKSLAYGLVGLLVLASIGIYFLNWQRENTLLTLRVINAEGAVTEYQAKKSALKGRVFTTVGGKHIQLADSDRLEILEAP